MIRFSGIGPKIFMSFIVLVLTGLVVGWVEYLTLNRVIESRDRTRLAKEVESRLFEARQQEKNLILRKDEESFHKLNQALDMLEIQSEGLKTFLAVGDKADEIKNAQVVYKEKASQLKRLLDDDAKALTALQEAAARIRAASEQQSNQAVVQEKDRILRASEDTLKQNALKRIKDVLSVGYDVLRFHYENALPLESALAVVRSMHFEGDNYFFVVKEDLTLVAHGADRKLEGMDFGKVRDKKTGRTFMKEIVSEAVKNGESCTEYYWTKPGMGDAVFPKVTIAKYFRPWGVIICAGRYIDDIEQETAKTGSLLQDGFDKLRQANAVRDLATEACLNAFYYFAFEQNADKVGEELGKLKGLPAATENIKKDAEAYLSEFIRRVRNNEDRNKTVAEIVSIARKAQGAANEVSKEAEEGAVKTANNGRTLMVAFVLAGALAGLMFAVFLVRAVTKPLKRAIAGLSEGSEQVSSASTQLAAASQQLAEGTSEQAASIEETSSALEEMASMTKQNAGNANQANLLITETRETVARAGQTMGMLTTSMGEISKASEETSKIIKTIDEIAFQTNLLALNAAVEAARAGGAGAGFAVVADEVRNLAMRAAEAAKNTANLIEGTVKRVREGSELVDKTDKDFSEVADSVVKSGDLVGEISAACQEQAEGIEQVNKAVSEMDKIVQQNAANAEETASVSETMNAQALRMKKFIGELAAMIGGADGDRTRGDGGPAGVKIGIEAASGSLKPPNFNGKIENGKANGKGNAHHRKHQLNAEQVIPLDDAGISRF